MKKFLTLLPCALVLCGVSCKTISVENLTPEDKFDKALGFYAQGLLAFEDNSEDGVKLLLHAVELDPLCRHFIDDYLKILERKILKETTLSDDVSEFEKKHRTIIKTLLPILQKSPHSYYLQMKVVDSCLQVKELQLADRLLHQNREIEDSYHLLSLIKFYRITDDERLRRTIELAGTKEQFRKNFSLQHQALLIYLGFNEHEYQSKILQHTLQLLKILPSVPQGSTPPQLNTDLINGIIYGSDIGEGARAQCIKEFYSGNRNVNSQWSLLAGILMKLEHYDAAYNVIKDKVLGKTGQRWLALYNLSRCAYMTGRNRERIDYLEEALRYQPGNTSLKRQLIAAHTAYGDPQRSLELITGDGHNNSWLVKIRMYNFKKLSRIKSAFTEAEKIYNWPDPAQRLRAVSPYFVRESIEVYLAAGQPGLLIDRLKDGIKYNYKDTNLKNSVVYILVENHMILPWLETLMTDIAEVHPQNSSYLDTFAWLRFRQKRYPEARELIDRALSHSEKSSGTIYLHAGDIYHATGDSGKAVEFWKKALQTDKNLSEKINIRLNNENITD